MDTFEKSIEWILGACLVVLSWLLFIEKKKNGILWIFCFAAGLLFWIVGIILFCGNKKRVNTRHFRSAFWEYIACTFMYIPIECYARPLIENTGIPCVGFIHVADIIVSAFIKSFSSYPGFAKVKEINEVFPCPVRVDAYNLAIVLINICILFFMGGAILKILDSPFQRLKLLLHSCHLFRKQSFYIFSCCNSKSLEIAKSIPTEDSNHRRIIIFACGEVAVDAGIRGEIDAIQGIYINEAVSEVIKTITALASKMEIFLFEESEENNLRKLENICRHLEKSKKAKNIKIMLELTETPWDLYDNYIKKYQLSGKNIIINFIRTEETFVYSNLLKYSIFKNAVQNQERKEIRALIIGKMIPRNIEMLKALLHLSQMPGYFLNLTVIDSERGRNKLKQMMPEVYDDGAGYGDAEYHITYKENVDFSSNIIETVIEESCSDFTFAFVNAGVDLVNINIALQIKALASRRGRSIDSYLLQVSITNNIIWEKWNASLCTGIIPVGSFTETYSYPFVTNPEIEDAAKKIHEVRHHTSGWEEYLNNEYNRHSVLARTLSFKYKIEILDKEYNQNYKLAGAPSEPVWYTKKELEAKWAEMSEEEIRWKVYEHMRWNVYTRTLGYRFGSTERLSELLQQNEALLYVIKAINQDLDPLKEKEKHLGYLSDEEKKKKIQLEEQRKGPQKKKTAVWNEVKEIRASAKIHNDLVPFNQLPLSEKIKDNLELPQDVIDVLIHI